jgi:hypothetical protein
MNNKITPANAFAAERSLYETVDRLDKNPQGKVAIHVHLSKLQQHRRRDQYIRIAVDTFEAQLKPLGGQIFQLHNFDVVYLGTASDLLTLEAAINRLRLLFQEDPLAQFAAVGEDSGMFCTWYRLDKDYDAFLNLVRGVYRAAEQSRTLLIQEQEIKETTTQLRSLEPDVLAKLEQAIAKADLANVIRSQTACTVLADQPMMPLFKEYFVNISDLQSYVTPGIELRSNRWLFQYLTGALDKRMLAYIMRERIVNSDTAFSLNLNVNTVLSPQFRKFDETIPNITRGRLVVEMQMIDVFADLGAFIFARDYLQERGYRVCLDGITHLTLRYVDRARLGVDLVKLYWTPEGVNTIEPNMLQHFKQLVTQTGQARTILCRCEDEFALEFGRSAGIMMFQGHYIERMYARQRDEAVLKGTQKTIAAPITAAAAAKAAAPELKATR